jgi:eukaryotic-like serine/threonine-protein kinase
MWLLSLAEEMNEAIKDGTLPSVLAVDRVWVARDGRARLLDFAAPGSAPQPTGSSEPTKSDLWRAQDFLGDVSATLTSGPIPLTVRAVFETAGLHAPDVFLVKVRKLLDQPPADTRRLRLSHLLSGGMALIVGVGAIAAFRAGFIAGITDARRGEPTVGLHAESIAESIRAADRTGEPQRRLSARTGKKQSAAPRELETLAGTAVVIAGAGLLSGLFFRGGLSLRAFGLAVVEPDGSKPSSLKAAGRSLVAWLPFWIFAAATLFGSKLLSIQLGEPVLYSTAVACALIFLGGAVYAGYHPERSLQDRIAGTYLVPR